MELPIELRNIIDTKLENTNIKDIQKDAENISLKYRHESGTGKKLVTKEMEALAYSVVRMPATFAAVYTAIKNTFDIYDTSLTSLLDVGAGTGAGTWAACEFLNFKKITCLEREDVMMNLGKSLMSESDNLKNAEWRKFDLVTDEITEKSDLVICSYVLNELNDKDRIIALEKLWNATNKILVIIEPRNSYRI